MKNKEILKRVELEMDKIDKNWQKKISFAFIKRVLKFAKKYQKALRELSKD